jgi:hypothetical protein
MGAALLQGEFEARMRRAGLEIVVVHLLAGRRTQDEVGIKFVGTQVEDHLIASSALEGVLVAKLP